jgi:hypothetical protein
VSHKDALKEGNRWGELKKQNSVGARSKGFYVISSYQHVVHKIR